MIREIYVNGYRSLEAIKIPLRTGVNILVGPNGGGKTNILSFFEFLSKITSMPVDEAVSSHGGVGRVFSRRAANQFQTHFNAQISGSVDFQTRGGYSKNLYYTWSFEISASDNYEEINYEEQILYISIGRKPHIPENSDLILKTLQNEHGHVSITVRRMVISRLQHFFRAISFLNVDSYYTHSHAMRFFEYYTRYNDLSKGSVFNAFPTQVTIIRTILKDFEGGQIFNIAPEACKQPEDSARPPIIEKNGAGLASVLHRLGKPTIYTVGTAAGGRRVRVQRDQGKLEKIKSYLKLVNPDIMETKTEKNPVDNTIVVLISVFDDGDIVDFPLSQCSDGTVKWVALLTKVITDSGGFSIEEPENYLHPRVQREFLNVVRTESGQTSPYTLMTTHSESLLNEADPQEVILVWMDSGKTLAKRVANAEELKSEIDRTGFGLGHYYVTGALQGA